MKFNLFFILVLLFNTKAYNQQVSFTDRTSQLVYVQGTMGQAKCGVDMNGDGLDDITRVSKDGIYIDFQLENGQFQHKWYSMPIRVLPEWSVCAGDLNGDGLNDLIFGGNGKISYIISDLYHGNFIEKVLPDIILSQRSTLSDIDNDGDLDGFICNDTGQSLALKNDGAGNLHRDPILIQTSTLPGNYAAIWCDYNLDGYTDLYVSKCLAEALPGNPARTNLLYKNNGDGTFTEAAKEAGIDDNAQSWATVFEDFDEDGDFDAFVVNHDQQNRLYRNNHDGTFSDVIAVSGIDAYDTGAFENTAGDFNNDGHIDIISELKNQIYFGHGDLTFTGQELSFTPGAIGDFNHDGFLDVTYRSQLYINDGNDNHWVKFRLRGIQSNINGVGAKVVINGPWGSQIRELRSGQSYSPMNSLDIHFGLGQDSIIEKAEISWPSGIITELHHLASDTTYVIPEGVCMLPSIKIGAKNNLPWCNEETIVLIAPPGFKKYLWSDNSTSDSLIVKEPGRYRVLYWDSLFCVGLSTEVSVLVPDNTIPVISVQEGGNFACEGDSLVLVSSAGAISSWISEQKQGASITVGKSGFYQVRVPAACHEDSLISAPIEITFAEARIPELDSVVQTADSILFYLNGDHCLWFDSLYGGHLIGEGCVWKTTKTDIDKTVYAENGVHLISTEVSGGKADTAGTAFIIPSSKIMYFTSVKAFEIVTVDMYIKSESDEGVRVVQLLSDQGGVLDETSSFLKKGLNTVPLSFHIPPGHYALRCNRFDQISNVGPLDYPYPLGHFGQIDSSSTSLNFYPYFFNWKIKGNNQICRSERLALHIEANSLSKPPFSTKIFPNPADHFIEVTSDSFSGNTHLSIFSVNGQLQSSAVFESDRPMRLETSHLNSGFYLLKFTTSGFSTFHFFSIVR